MEMRNNNNQNCKRSRICNGAQVAKLDGCNDNNDDGEDGNGKISEKNGREISGIVSWQHQIPPSRIYRVSRASGGKDRHSKVYTTKGLRDRRIRLSVSTAIQFYDLQDRLGYDQPSKAIEWLLKAADSAISDLPPLDGFPIGENRQIGMETDENLIRYIHTNNKSVCSSTSETSKCSELSLSRSKTQAKARGRNRKDSHSELAHTSFTDLLEGSNAGRNVTEKQTSTADYFNQSVVHNHEQSPFGMMQAMNIAAAAEIQQQQQQQQHLQFMQDNVGDYNLNFSISSGSFSGLNRGTLQSNLPHNHMIQRFSSVDANNLPLLFGAAENQFLAGFDGRLQLCYGDGLRHSDGKGKGKN